VVVILEEGWLQIQIKIRDKFCDTIWVRTSRMK